MRTWADWHDAVPGFVEIDLVGHEGGVPSGEHAYTLTVTDLATGWTENRSVRNKAQRWVFAALMDIRDHLPFPLLGIDSDTLTVTDLATGWTENRSVRNKAQRWVFAALMDIRDHLPFPLLGIDSDNGSEFINHHLFAWCTEHQVTFTRSRSGNKNDGAHVEQKNWTQVRQIAGYHRYDTAAELELLNRIWTRQTD